MKKWENFKINDELFEVNTVDVEIENNGYCTIVSRNCNFFSIAGYVTDKDTKERYYCYITASHNKAWKVVEG